MLNLEEQLDVQRGELKPTLVEDLLIELTHASGLNFARDFSTSYKVFDQGTPEVPLEVDAAAYLNKMLSAGNRMITGNSTQLQSLNNVMASLISGTAVATVPIIENATLEQWEGFINDNIQKAFELFAQVRQEEKTAYDTIL